MDATSILTVLATALLFLPLFIAWRLGLLPRGGACLVVLPAMPVLWGIYALFQGT